MTTRPGADWGEVVTRPAGAVEAWSDADVANAGAQAAPLVLRAGDLLRTLGGSSTGDRVVRLSIDLVEVIADDRRLTAAAHVVVRRRGWFGGFRGPLIAVLNAEFVGRWDVAPRAHPNDGWLDVLEVDRRMPARARWQAWRRLPTGTHVPHPDIATRRVRDATFTFDDPLGLWVDDVDHGTVRTLALRIVPDAAEIHV